MKVRCPVCKKYSEWSGNKWRPFCSERCRNFDLAAWADEDYRIADSSNSMSRDCDNDGSSNSS